MDKLAAAKTKLQAKLDAAAAAREATAVPTVIISDEALSSETSNGTEFVVLMRGEPGHQIPTPRRGG